MTLASILVGEGSTEAAIALYGELVRRATWQPRTAPVLGHALKTQGVVQMPNAHIARLTRQRANFGDAYWSLANLKTYRFSDEQLATMRDQVDARRTPPVDRYHLCFALGKALEDRGEYAESFQFYARGNALKKDGVSATSRGARADDRQADRTLHARVLRAAARAMAATIPRPIFIVGLPRAGSTLLEQILASHSQVEGTMELADIPRLVSALDLHASGARYPACSRCFRRTIIAASAKPTFATRDTTASATGRSSSTRCRTISAT